MPPLHRRSEVRARTLRTLLTEDDIYWAGKLLPSILHVTWPNFLANLFDLDPPLRPVSCVRPCSMCYVSCCGGTGSPRRRGTGAEREPTPLFRKHFLLLLRRSREIYPLFPPERQMQSGTDEPTNGRRTRTDGRTTGGTEFAVNISPMQCRRQMAAPHRLVTLSVTSNNEVSSPLSTSLV